METCINFSETVANELGKGFSESIYQECLAVLLRENNIKYSKEYTLPKMFNGCSVGFIRADITLPDLKLVIECKAINDLQEVHFPQIITYLEILGYQNGLFVNFVQNPCKPLLQIQKVSKISDTLYLFEDHYNGTTCYLSNKGVKVIVDTSEKEKHWIKDNIIESECDILYKKDIQQAYFQEFKKKDSSEFVELVETYTKDTFTNKQRDTIKYKMCIFNYKLQK